MSTRILMLVLTVGAFIVMWSGDHQASNPNKSMLEEIPTLEGTAPGPILPLLYSVKVSLFWEEAEDESDPFEVSDSPETVFSTECFPEADWMSSKVEEHFEEIEAIQQHEIIASSLKTKDWDLTSMVVWSDPPEIAISENVNTIPLPVDLTPGEYRIFNDEGGEYVKTWTAEELASIGIPDSVPALNSYMLEEQGRRWFFYRVNRPKIISTTIESDTEQSAGNSRFSEDEDNDEFVSISFDPIEPIEERFLFVNEQLEMALCRAEWFFSSIQINVKSTIQESAEALAGMTAEAIQQTRQLWERAEGISKKPERAKTPPINIRNANRFRCRRFY